MTANSNATKKERSCVDKAKQNTDNKHNNLSCNKARKNKKISENLKKAITEWKPMVGSIDNGECPKCFGNYIAGHKCECPCESACRFYTYDNMGERSRQTKWENFLTVPLDEKLDWEDEEEEEAEELMPSPGNFMDGNGNLYGSDDVNITVLQTYVWLAIESPETAKAIMMRLNPNIKSLHDMADLLGVTKQAIHKRIANELGIGKRNLTTSLLRLSGKELDVYKLCIEQKLSIRKAAKVLGMSKSTIDRILDSIKEKGFKE